MLTGATRRIPIHERVELPESWIPADSRVEIDAKINAGMCGRMLSCSLVLTQPALPCRILHDRPPHDGGRAQECAGPDLGGVSTTCHRRIAGGCRADQRHSVDH